MQFIAQKMGTCDPWNENKKYKIYRCPAKKTLDDQFKDNCIESISTYGNIYSTDRPYYCSESSIEPCLIVKIHMSLNEDTDMMVQITSEQTYKKIGKRKYMFDCPKIKSDISTLDGKFSVDEVKKSLEYVLHQLSLDEFIYVDSEILADCEIFA